MSPGRRGMNVRSLLLRAAAPLLVLLVYLPTLGYTFLWDDLSFLVENTAVHDLEKPWRHFIDESTASEFEQSPGIYRPLRNLWWAAIWTLVGESPAAFHFAGVLLHGLVCLALFEVVFLLLVSHRVDERGRAVSSCMAACLFAVHPLVTEAVAWVKAQDDLLVALFCCLGAVWMLRTSRPGEGQTVLRPSATGVVGLLLLQWGALASKETGLVYPGLVLLVLLLAGGATSTRRAEGVGQDTFASRSFARLAQRSTTVFIALAAMLDAGYLWVRATVLGEVGQVEEPLAVGAELLWTQLKATALGVRLAFVPWPLTADYDAFPRSPSADFWSVISLGVVAVLVALAVRWLLSSGAAGSPPRHGAALGFASAWWLCSILPVSNVVPTMQFLAERFLYLPLLGVAIAVGCLLPRWMMPRSFDVSQNEVDELRADRRVGWSRAAVVALALVGVGALAGTTLRLPVWRDPISLFASAAQHSPQNIRAASNHARALFNGGRYGESVDALERLHALDPESGAVQDLVDDARRLAAYEDRLAELLETFDRHPEDLVLGLTVGELALRARLSETAEGIFKAVLEQHPDAWRAWAGLAVAAALRGDGESAQERFDRAVSQAPKPLDPLRSSRGEVGSTVHGSSIWSHFWRFPIADRQASLPPRGGVGWPPVLCSDV